MPTIKSYEMSKSTNFLTELKTLCKKHDVHLRISGYDGIEIYDLNESEVCIYANRIEDHTDETLANNKGCWKEIT